MRGADRGFVVLLVDLFSVVALHTRRGGVPPAAISGRGVIGMICNRDGKKLRTSLPAVS